MSAVISRRQFLRSDFRGRTPALRPPWAVSPFDAHCDGCAACVDACPTRIISLKHRLAQVDFSQGECDFCGRCVEACQRGALRRQEQPWDYRAQIDASCLARNRVHCRTCEEQCEAGAIRFRLRPGGVAHPEIDADHCNGCGACVAPCPVTAIDIQSHALTAKEVGG